MTDLSPAAQAVLNAINKELDKAPWNVSFLAGVSASAVLRVAADQMSCYQSKKFLYSIADAMKLRAIATELEGK
jgi:hypothetical protein